MKKISLFLLLSNAFLSFSQGKDKITIQKQDEFFFYRLTDTKDSLLIKDSTDIFFIKMSPDKKACTEVRIKNATFLKTENDNQFKLVYAPGMKYRLVYVSKPEDGAYGSVRHQKHAKMEKNQADAEPQIGTDGATNDGSKEIIIELVDTKTDKVFLTNVFYYKNK